MRKFAGFLILIGFVLIGMSCYQMFVGDIPFLSFMEKEEEDSEVIGPPIKVEKISTIEYTPVVGEDYEVNTRYTKRSGTNLYSLEYYVTIKPASLVKYGYNLSKYFTVYYMLSNANTSIYLDALEVSRENAKPKVSYNVSINVLNTDLMHILYKKLAQVVMINDTDLKFENVFGLEI